MYWNVLLQISIAPAACGKLNIFGWLSWCYFSHGYGPSSCSTLMNFMGLFWTRFCGIKTMMTFKEERGWMFIDLLTTVVDRIVTIVISCQCSTAFCALFELWCFTVLISFPSSISLILDKLSCCFCRGRGGIHGAQASFHERFLERWFFCLDVIVSD